MPPPHSRGRPAKLPSFLGRHVALHASHPAFQSLQTPDDQRKKVLEKKLCALATFRQTWGQHPAPGRTRKCTQLPEALLQRSGVRSDSVLP